MSRQKTPYLKYKPQGMKDLTWRIIVEAWENDCSNREVSLRLARNPEAEPLSVDEVTKLYQKNKELADFRSMLRTGLVSDARLTVRDAIKEGDVATSKWYLERKQADEFSTKQAVALEDAVVELSIKDKEEALKQMIEKFESDAK